MSGSSAGSGNDKTGPGRQPGGGARRPSDDSPGTKELRPSSPDAASRTRYPQPGVAREATAGRGIDNAANRTRALEQRLSEANGELTHARSQNDKLQSMLRDARKELRALREEVDKLTQPPSGYATVLGCNDDDSVDVRFGGRKMRVSAHPDLIAELRPWRPGGAQRVIERGARASAGSHRRGGDAQRTAPRRRSRGDIGPSRRGSGSSS